MDGTIDPNTITISGTIDATKKGTYPVTLSVSDAAGNKGEKTINVIVDDPTTFFNSIDGIWKFETTPLQSLTIKKESNRYLMYIGFDQSEGSGGEFTFKSVSADKKTAVLTWIFFDEGGQQNVEVNVDIGVAGDKKMKMDFGEGWENLLYVKGIGE